MMKNVRGFGKGLCVLSALLLMFAVVGCDDSDSTAPDQEYAHNGRVFDGAMEGSTVTVTNASGATESAKTNVFGNFQLTTTDQNAFPAGSEITVRGGSDITTGQDMVGVWKSRTADDFDVKPVRNGRAITVISPLTTLIVEAGDDANAVLTTLGLSNTDVYSTDPVGNIALQATAAKIAIMANTVAEAIYQANNDVGKDVAYSNAMKAAVTKLKATGASIDFSDQDISDIIDAAAGDLEVDNDMKTSISTSFNILIIELRKVQNNLNPTKELAKILYVSKGVSKAIAGDEDGVFVTANNIVATLASAENEVGTYLDQAFDRAAVDYKDLVENEGLRPNSMLTPLSPKTTEEDLDYVETGSEGHTL